MEASIYKQKYTSLKQRYQTDLDAAFRLGYEKGAQEAQMEAQMQQLQQQAEAQQAAAQQAAAMGGQPAPDAAGGQEMSPEEQAMIEAQGGQQQPSEEEMAAQQASPEEMAQQGELDSKIEELEGLLSKGEKPKILDLRKAVQELASIRKNQMQKINKKTEKVETKQRSIVKNILKKWQDDSKSVTTDLEKILETDGLKLGE